ncbi:MAG: sycd5 [Chlamydiales bacterium]|jgi:type III secretion system low calcium response chaperone LcrH/SycD|nr:sycd5 [Chlamydiales bacterium]
MNTSQNQENKNSEFNSFVDNPFTIAMLKNLPPEQQQELLKFMKSPEMASFINKQLPNMDKLSKGMFTELFRNNATLRQVFKLPKEFCELMYAKAYQHYSQGQYEEAMPLFRALVYLEGIEHKYSFGLAACMHMQQMYQEATKMYLFAAQLDASNPLANFHAADCFIQLEDYFSAKMTLLVVIENPYTDMNKYAQVKEKASEMLIMVQQKLDARKNSTEQ